MISTSWLKKRRECWVRLQQLLDTVDLRGVRTLDRFELREISLLYRQTASDLSTLRQDSSGGAYEKFVHQLLRRAHNLVYAGEKPGRKGILSFFVTEYPLVFQRNIRLVAVSVVLFLAAAVLGVILTLHDPDFAGEVLGPQMIQSIERHEMWTHSIVSIEPAASSWIMTNNMSVGITMFAGGITAGIFTVWLTFFNGLMIGVVGSACWLNGMSLQLWSFVAPHGALELPAIFIAAAAGLRIAQGLLFPGLLSRRDSLTLAGGEAVRLLLGTIPILIIAGLIEGFVSPGGMAVKLKFGLGAAMFMLLSAYLFSPLLRARRGTEKQSESKEAHSLTRTQTTTVPSP